MKAVIISSKGSYGLGDISIDKLASVEAYLRQEVDISDSNGKSLVYTVKHLILDLESEKTMVEFWCDYTEDE